MCLRHAVLDIGEIRNYFGFSHGDAEIEAYKIFLHNPHKRLVNMFMTNDKVYSLGKDYFDKPNGCSIIRDINTNDYNKGYHSILKYEDVMPYVNISAISPKSIVIVKVAVKLSNLLTFGTQKGCRKNNDIYLVPAIVSSHMRLLHRVSIRENRRIPVKAKLGE